MVDGTFLGHTGKYDLLGVVNGFRKFCEAYIPLVVDSGKWFTVCHKINDEQVDIMALEGSDGVRLGRCIHDLYSEGGYRSMVYKYLLSNFLCYVEVPKSVFKTDSNGYIQTFDKMLATSNLEVIARWEGYPDVDSLPDKYKARVYGIGFDDGDDLIPYVKLYESKQGIKKVTCPKKDLDVSVKGTRVIPLFMLKSGVDRLYSHLSKGLCDVSFVKDNGQGRTICTTFDNARILDIYGSGDFYDYAVQGAYKGVFLDNSSLARGYIRVPEVGGSMYDNPTRSINYARIYSINFNSNPDLAFIRVDLGSVVPCFEDYIMRIPNKASSIIDMIIACGLDRGYWSDEHKSRDVSSLLMWVDSMNMVYSTVFLRELHFFMIANFEWFPNYDGSPKGTLSFDSGDVGLG